MLKRILFVSLIAGLVAVPAAMSGAGSTVKCKVGHAGWPASCADRVGDVKGGPGPDITRVTEYQWGVIIFRITFAKTPPLAHSATFADTVSVSMSARGETTKRYVLSFSTGDPTHVVLRQLPNGKPILMAATRTVVSGKDINIGVALRRIGNPNTVTFRVKATRKMVNGHPGGTDYTPDTGTMKWVSSMAPEQ